MNKIKKYKIEYKLINDSNSNDRCTQKLKCIIEDKKTIFEFTDEALRRRKDYLNLGDNLSTEVLYKTIESFLVGQYERNTLQDRYRINSNNFSEYIGD